MHSPDEEFRHPADPPAPPAVPASPTALERLWAPVIAAWKKDSRPSGWRLSKIAEESLQGPGLRLSNGEVFTPVRLPRSTIEDWASSWTRPDKPLPMPESRDQFLTLGPKP